MADFRPYQEKCSIGFFSKSAGLFLLLEFVGCGSIRALAGKDSARSIPSVARIIGRCDFIRESVLTTGHCDTGLLRRGGEQR